MTTTTEQTWLDIIPALPLDQAVPVAGYAQDSIMRGVVVRRRAHGDWQVEHTSGAAWPTVGWRVDLDDPQGFGYALRMAAELGACNSMYIAECGIGWNGIVAAYFTGRTDDADRLALARALAEAF